MDEPINALVMDEEKPAASPCSCDSLKEQIADLTARLDFVEHNVALLQDRDQGRGLLYQVFRAMGFKTVA